jgi:hypothetical protein
VNLSVPHREVHLVKRLHTREPLRNSTELKC